jgi:hypothetical protein
MGALIDLTGERFGEWLVIQQAPSLKRGGFAVARWVCRCLLCGDERVVEGTNLRSGRSRRCVACHERPGRPKLAMVTYRSLHERLRRERGRAVEHACVDCGQKARQWSLDRYEADDLIDTDRNSPVRYSLDLSRYVARCIPDHTRHDAALRRKHTTEPGSAVPCTQTSSAH